MNHKTQTNVRTLAVGLLITAVGVTAAGYWFVEYRPSDGVYTAAATTERYVDLKEATAAARPERKAVSEASEVASERPVDAGPGVAFSVVSESAAPVPGATIAIVDETADVVGHGCTDAAGRWRLSGPPSAALLSVYVSAEGFADRRLELPHPIPQDTRIELPAAVAIHGHVLRAGDAAPAPEGTRVVAWRTIDRPAPRLFRALDRGLPTLLETRTDAKGNFVLDGAEAGVAYSIAAGRTGWTTLEPAVDVKAEEGSVEIELWRLYGAVVAAKLRGGGDPDPSILGRWYLGAPDGSSDSSVNWPSLETALAGIHEVPGIKRRGAYDWRRQLVLFAGRFDWPELSGCSIRYRIPGLAPIAARLALPAVDGKLFEQEVTVHQAAHGVGTLRLRIAGSVDTKQLGRIYSNQPAHIELVPENPADRPIRAPIRDLSNGVTEVEGIPYGTYRVSFAVRNRVVSATAKEIHVGAEPVELNAKLSGIGAVLLRPKNADSELLSSNLYVSVLQGGVSVGDVSFGRPPYALQGLAKGEYRLVLTKRDRNGTKQSVTIENVVVENQKIAEVEYQWKR